MEILGTIAYMVLIFIALGWMLGVRIKLGITSSTIFGSLIFAASAVILPVIGADFIHSLWLIPVGFIIPMILAKTMPHSKFLTRLVQLLVSIYAGVIRIGISKDKIRKAQQESLLNTIENMDSKQSK